jgi:uncharacterized protein YggE
MRARLLLLAGATCVPALLVAQAPRDSVVTVTVVRQARLEPDRASFFAIVEGTAETPGDAATRVTAKARAIFDALKGTGAGGAASEIVAPFVFGVGPTGNRNGYPAPSSTPSFTARAVVRVAQARPQQAATLMATALGAGASNISFVTWESSLADSVRRAKGAEALAAAEREAAALATTLGGRLGALVDVTGTPNAAMQQRGVLTVDYGMGQEMMTPEVPVAATVTVRYRLVR